MAIKAPQTEAFLRGEGDAWFKRNRDKPKHDVVTPHIIALGIKPDVVVEFGCGDGERLGFIHRIFPASHCLGVDPSQAAVDEAIKKNGNLGIDFIRGTADFPLMVSADLIIYGFCLYLVDRELLQRVVYEADAMLREGGHIIIHDFDPSRPHKVPYHHLPGLFSYKMDHSLLWLGNPSYQFVTRSRHEEQTAVTVIRKDTNRGWPR